MHGMAWTGSRVSWSVADPDGYPGPRIWISSIPDPGSKSFRIPDPDPHQIILSILTQKIVSKLSEKRSEIFIPDPDPGSGSWFFTRSGSQIPDPTIATKEKRKEKNFFLPFLVATSITKSKNGFTFEQVKKKIWANLQRIILFTQKIVIDLSKICAWDPGKKPIPDPGSRGKKGTGSRIHPQHWNKPGRNFSNCGLCR